LVDLLIDGAASGENVIERESLSVRHPAPALRHRLRRNPLDDTGSTERIERAVAELWPS